MAKKKIAAEDGKFLPSENTSYVKSNFLIGAKYKSTLLENKIMAYSLANAEKFDYGVTGSSRETILSVIPVSDLRKALGANSGSFYQQLASAAKSMTGKSIGMTSADKRSFDYIAVISRARLENGQFYIEYNGAVRDVIENLSSNYSRLDLSIELRFKNNYSFRMYELLKSKCYHSKNDPDQNGNVYFIRMSLSELKLELGVVNAELDAVKRILRDAKNPDYDHAVEIAPERMFDDWSEFKRKVIDKGLKEINEITEMQVTYEPVRRGAGGKVRAINFTVVMGGAGNSEKKVRAEDISLKKRELTEDDQLDFIDELRTLTNGEFTSKQLKEFALASEWNKEKIQGAYRIYQSQSAVDNPVGWMISAIKKGYKEAAPVGKRKGKRAVQANFEEREYDWDALENAILTADEEPVKTHRGKKKKD